MDYKKLYEKQYGEKKLTNVPKKQFLGLRKFLKRYDYNRYDVAEHLIDPGERILDIGCGNGNMLRKVKDRYQELYGVDISPSRIEEAIKITKDLCPSDILKIKFVEGNADSSLPFQDNYFDTIVCIAVIEHVYDIFFLVKEIYRTLKPGGYVIAEVPNIGYLKYRIQFLFGKLPATSSPYNWEEIGWDGGHIHYFTMEKFCWLFEQSGFKIEKKTGSGFLAKFRNWWPSLLTGDLFIKATE
ncbi:2-methoxy-6-polyprenyl-1,4-benzoquinol methylase, mitochondrial [subsurface metagenome]